MYSYIPILQTRKLRMKKLSKMADVIRGRVRIYTQVDVTLACKLLSTILVSLSINIAECGVD